MARSNSIRDLVADFVSPETFEALLHYPGKDPGKLREKWDQFYLAVKFEDILHPLKFSIWVLYEAYLQFNPKTASLSEIQEKREKILSYIGTLPRFNEQNKSYFWGMGATLLHLLEFSQERGSLDETTELFDLDSIRIYLNFCPVDETNISAISQAVRLEIPMFNCYQLIDELLAASISEGDPRTLGFFAAVSVITLDLLFKVKLGMNRMLYEQGKSALVIRLR